MLFLHCRLIITTVLFLSTNPNPKVCPHTRLITNIFSKVKADVFTSHCFYNLKINLKESAQPLVAIYSLLVSEQKTLKEFTEKNLNTGFI